jgi:hypothetical protein
VVGGPSAAVERRDQVHCSKRAMPTRDRETTTSSEVPGASGRTATNAGNRAFVQWDEPPGLPFGKGRVASWRGRPCSACSSLPR